VNIGRALGDGIPNKSFWVRAFTGYDYALLGDLGNGVKGLVALNQIVEPTAAQKPGNSGIRAGVEIGYSLDDLNAFFIVHENAWTQDTTYTDSVSNQKFSPRLMSFALNYERCLFDPPGFRTLATVGGGFYRVEIGYSAFDPNIPATIGANFSGEAFGGNLGLAQEMEIAGPFSLSLSVKGRLATFSQVISPSITNNGNVVTTNAPYTLAIVQAPNFPEYISIAAVKFLGTLPGRYVVLDYSGVSGDLDFNFYF
jgi:hypothetical protein